MNTNPRLSFGGSNAPRASHPDRSCTSTCGSWRNRRRKLDRVLRMQFAARQTIALAATQPGSAPAIQGRDRAASPAQDSAPKRRRRPQQSAVSRRPPRLCAAMLRHPGHTILHPHAYPARNTGLACAANESSRRNQQRVLEAIREIPRVIGVAIVHPGIASRASSGHRGRALTSMPSLHPSRSRSMPAQATITALSEQSLTGGATSRNPRDRAASANPARTDVFDATPPATTNSSAPGKRPRIISIACPARSASTSTTAC